MILKSRIRRLEAENADLRAALEACIRAMDKGWTGYITEWMQAKEGARKLLAPANQNDDRTPASAQQVSPEQKKLNPCSN